MMTQTASNIYYNKLTRLPCINFETVNSALSQLPELIISACGTHLKLEEGEGLCLAIAEAEMLFSRATSLMEKFDDNEIVDSLIRTSQMILSGEKKKKKFINLFLINEGNLNEADAKEFILRAMTPRPFNKSERVGNRMYVLLSTNEIRVASAFSLNE